MNGWDDYTDGLKFIWMACDCYIWPIDQFSGRGRCGWCKVSPHTIIQDDYRVKAGPLNV